MNRAFIEAIDALVEEKGMSKEELFDVVESSLVTAYKKDYGSNQNVSAYIDRETGDISIYLSLKVVEEVEDDSLEISLEEAQEIDTAYEVGDEVEYMVTPSDFSRIAAQNVKNTIMQKIKENEREQVYDEYIDKVGTIMMGVVHRENRGTLYVNLGKADGMLHIKEQTPGERYNLGDKIRVYVMDVKKTTKGPQIFLSRSHPGLVRQLFEREVPELTDGTVEIKGIAREAGSRTKMAVMAMEDNIDPVGACVGSRGVRVQNVVDELYNEKIDILVWSEDPYELIRNVLSPAKVESVEIYEEEQTAKVLVDESQLSLAIGKSGQNVRLAAKVCGWKIDIRTKDNIDDDIEDLLREDDYTVEIDELDNEDDIQIVHLEEEADV